MRLPRYIEVETSRYCNRQCAWCPNHALQNRTTEELMPWVDVERIIRSLSLAHYAGWLAFHNYNEPLANPRIVEELRFAHIRLPAARLTIFTNGDRLTADLLAALTEAGLSQMRVTVYPKRISDAHAGHERLWAWLERKSFLLSLRWQETAARQGPALIHAGVPELLLISPHVERYYDRGDVIPRLSVAGRVAPCLLTSHSLSIDYMGNIKMCCNVVTGHEAHRPYFMGNIRDHDPLEIWSSPAFERLRNLHRRSDWSETPLCATCRQELKPS